MELILLLMMAFSLPQVFPACQNVSFIPYRSIPSNATSFIKEKLANLTKREDITELISSLTEDMFIEHVTQLSGEHTGSSQYDRVSNGLSRSNSITQACEYVEDKMSSYGFDVEYHQYRSDYGPNVISILRGTTLPDELVILGAHLDDRPYTGRAPGANDDGSGSSALLSMAQTIHEKGSTFERTLVFEHYTGEEQGLTGSRALALKRSQDGDLVRGQIQQDMTAVQLEGDSIGLAFVQDSRAVDLDFTAYVYGVAEKYRDSRLTLHQRVLSGSSCCSDHQSYAERGFLSAGLIEPRGYTGDPQYHRVGDVVERDEFSTLQGTLSAQVALAMAADLATLL